MALLKPNWTSGIFCFLLALLVIGGMQYYVRGHYPDPDGFYHAKASQLLVEGNLQDQFPWLYFTTWNEQYADQHYLYHWLLVPFNTIDKLPFSIIVFALIFVSLFIATLSQFNIRFKPFWVSILLFSSIDFLFRINLVKANTISLALLCTVVILMYRYHLKPTLYSIAGIGFVSAMFVWTYGGFVFVPFLLGAYALTYVTSKRSLSISTLKIATIPVLVSIVGIGIGMVFHPHSHNLYSLLIDQIFRTGLGAGSVVPAGNEWLPFDLVWLFKSNILILTIWAFSIILYVKAMYLELQNKRLQDYTLVTWLQITTLGLFALTLWHRRFIEYFIPFAVLASALTYQIYLQNIEWKNIKLILKSWQVKAASIIILTLLLVAFTYNIKSSAQSLKSGEGDKVYKNAAVWIQQNSDYGDIVLNTQWDQFPQLFYYNDKNYYIVGLDPTFMYINDSQLYWQWRIIADDDNAQWESAVQVKGIISEDLNAKFIIIDRDRNPNIVDYLEGEGNGIVEIGFSESSIFVYKLR